MLNFNFKESFNIKQFMNMDIEKLEDLNFSMYEDIIKLFTEDDIEMLDIMNMIKYHVENNPQEYSIFILIHLYKTIVDLIFEIKKRYDSEKLYDALSIVASAMREQEGLKPNVKFKPTL